MKKLLLLAALGALPAFAAQSVLLETSLGDITIELDEDKAPASSANFLAYVQDGFYNGTVFHRVIDGFMIQGGGYDATLEKRATRAPIANESYNGLKNTRGTIAMARTNDPHSATSQFFINLVDNAFLDAGSNSQHGYTVFGTVVSGMDVVDAIGKLPTGAQPPFDQDVPEPLVVIKSARLLPEPSDSPTQEQTP